MKEKINWHSHPLTLKTKITESYKTTQNVRRFFNLQMGREVKLGREFMLWLHANKGKTLEQVIKKFKKFNP